MSAIEPPPATITSADGKTGAVADAAAGNWADRYAPRWALPYLRIARADRPIGGWLLMWPCCWASVLASRADGASMPNFWHLALFLVGAFVMRGAGCTYNDIVDRDIDGAVERTRSRPLPAGQVTVKAAGVFMVAQALVGFLVLLQFNTLTIITGAASLLVVAVYPFMKRVTYWPQSVLGLAFGWGALVGWTAIRGQFEWPMLALYAGTIAWIIGYDTIYAHQDREDDALIGMKSTALKFGRTTRYWLAGFYATAITLFAVAAWLAGAGPHALVGIGAVTVVLSWQVATLDIDDGANCLARFRANHLAGAVLFAGLALDLVSGM